MPVGRRVRWASLNPCWSLGASETKTSSTSSVAAVTRRGDLTLILYILFKLSVKVEPEQAVKVLVTQLLTDLFAPALPAQEPSFCLPAGADG